ncbi:MAG: AmmeMemoRadiSam system protein B [Candidatus Bathyarchaeota archaeon]|nr:AmmeMemoRadiSam system protein B [Candidatus Bathyarchaeota archaeon]
MRSLRRPVVAGMFYEGTAEELTAQIKFCFLHPFGPQKLPHMNPNGPRDILGLICPHAGYVYSGAVAANAFSALAQDGKPDTVVILGPNHTGEGTGLSIMTTGTWQTPLGDVKIDEDVAEALVAESGILDVDENAHRREHSIEVQLPFLQYLYGDNFKFVPICFLMQDLQSAREVGRALTEVLANKNAVVIASTDFTHYETQTSVNRKDQAAINAIENLNENQLYTVLEEQNISACGYAPIAALITYAKGLCAPKAQLLQHKTSGDITGDHTSTVGYAALTITKPKNACATKP